LEWVRIFMSIVCKKVSELAIPKYENLSRREYELGHMKIILMLIERETFLYAWLCSETLYQDLEYLYSMHLPSSQQWDKIVPQTYHEFIPGTEKNREPYLRNINLILKNVEVQQKFWLKLTERLMLDKNLVLEPHSQGNFSIEKNPRTIYVDFLKYLV